MRRKQILARAIEIQTVKYKAMYGVFFQIEALLPLKNAWFLLILFLDYKEHAKVCFLRIVLNHAKNIPVLVSTTHRKPEYLQMCRTYAK